MATIIRKIERDYQPNPNKIDGFRLFTDISREKKGIKPQYLNFDLRQLNPHEYCAAYHFHRYAEEMFLILSGSATLRTPDGFEEVYEGDIMFLRREKQVRINFIIIPMSLVLILIYVHI